MDPPTRTSGLPRMSKLPLPRSIPSSADGPIPSRLSKTASIGGISQLSSRAGSNAKPTVPQVIAEKRAKHSDDLNSAKVSDHEIYSPDLGTGTQNGDTAARDSSIAGSPPLSGTVEHRSSAVGTPLRKPRPSLSDRTVETLSQIPPSPATRRRQSGFFMNESPMRPGSRAGSSLNYSRPGSRADISLTPISKTERPLSPSKGPPLSHRNHHSISGTPSRRSVSTYLPRNSISLGRPSQDASNAQEPSNNPKPSRLHRPTASTVTNQIQKPITGSKTMIVRSPTKKAALQTVIAAEEPDSPKVLPSALSASRMVPRSTAASSLSLPKRNGTIKTGTSKIATKSAQNPQLVSTEEPRRVSASSQALRETIAKAKAAAKLAKSSSPLIPRSVGHDDLIPMTAEVDLNSLDLLDSVTNNVLRQRISIARTDGKLNIAVLGLTEIPSDVMNMYDSNYNNAGVAWFETVDLVRLNAADNEITELPENAFPADDAQDEGSRNIVFGALEALDIHGNRLKSIPTRLGNLSSLTYLNLTRNQLPNDCLLTISRIHSLVQLRLADNALRGSFPECISDLKNLELLDIHENALSDLPRSMEQLLKLKHLNVAGNKLTSLPLDTLAKLPLTELIASTNRLDGVLFPSTSGGLPQLRTLDIANNALLSIMDHTVNMPNLQSLDISNNRITKLPASTAWPDLLYLTATQNQISVMPKHLSSLRNLKSLDLCNNSLTSVDYDIGLMDNLTVLRLENNPIRERRLVKMTTEDLKTELRNRLSALISSPKSDTHSTISEPQTPASLWPVKAGVLERSRSKLKTIDASDLAAVTAQSNVKSLVLHHNLLQHIPQAVTVLASTLTALDLSYNKLGQTSAFVEQPISLPVLQSLNLTSNALTSLDTLVTYLAAPKLAILNVSFNRLTSFPALCAAFPALATLLASNNKINVLDVEAVRGVQTLDVSSNEIEQLPAQLAHLQGRLRTLMVTGNKFRVPSWGVVEKGTEEILNWCRMKLPLDEVLASVEELD
jgi:Leucine-rich repeat (LRR) protein